MTTASIISHFHEHDLEHFESKLSFILVLVDWIKKQFVFAVLYFSNVGGHYEVMLDVTKFLLS